ncbi:MAG: hypothetical protein KC535_02490 [Nanoarchaeota archaeon]|nr:hypothetical protein [Nanoarchaeota archaeon]
MTKLKELLSSTRVIVLLVFLLLSLVAINPQLGPDQVSIRSVIKDSAAAQATPIPFTNPDAGTRLLKREVIESINNRPFSNIDEYYSYIDSLEPNKTLIIKTDQQTYRLVTVPIINTTVLDEQVSQEVTTEVFDNQTNTTVNVTENIYVNKTVDDVIGTQDIGLVVFNRPSNNIQKGLDLEGGTRVLLAPEEQVSQEDMDTILENIRQRLNVYGVSDIVVRSVKDFTGETYVLVEIAGVSQEEIVDLLSRQGKFEAKVGDETVFRGGNDIIYVCRTATCSGIDPQYGCQKSAEGYTCGFRFSITLSQEAAQRQADVTKNLDVEYLPGSTQGYLSENLTLILDDEIVNELRIGSSLKGNAVTDISISGSGSGPTEQAAAQAALDDMKSLQTVLITGSLPVKLNIIQTDTISPVLGEEFVKNALLVGLFSLLAVVVVVVARYRKPIIAVPIIITMLSEVVILLGFAALIGWKLDLAAIAGIIIAVGTGVDDQIVIVDETLDRKKRSEQLSWQDKIKKAFFIIMTAYFTTVVAMLPLWFSGAGLLKGFALTTVVGVSIGVLITRPAFAKILEVFLEHDAE